MWGGRGLEKKKRILIVRLDGIGAFYIWLPCANALRQYYVGAEVTLLANSCWSDAAAKMLSFDHIIPLESERFIKDYSYRMEILMALRQQGFDSVLQPRWSREFLVEDQITVWCGAPENIAFKSEPESVNPKLMKWSDRGYTRLIERPPEIVHELEIDHLFCRKCDRQGRF